MQHNFQKSAISERNLTPIFPPQKRFHNYKVEKWPVINAKNIII